MNVIRFDQVSKWYPRYHRILTGLKSSLLHLRQTLHQFKQGRFVALDNVSFEIGSGEAVGLIGPNGSGKSTALGLIAGVLKVDDGLVQVQGHVAPMLELGAGFHPELTGRENIVLNGVLLGLTRQEVLTKMDEIVEFSQLDSFLDQPVYTYSSGMVARLGFSVAAHIDPDILLIDEALAVGDLHFQAKCCDRIKEFKRRGVTIVLVSHSTAHIRNLCDRVIWLDRGKVVGEGKPECVLSRYEKDQFVQNDTASDITPLAIKPIEVPAIAERVPRLVEN